MVAGISRYAVGHWKTFGAFATPPGKSVEADPEGFGKRSRAGVLGCERSSGRLTARACRWVRTRGEGRSRRRCCPVERRYGVRSALACFGGRHRRRTATEPRNPIARLLRCRMPIGRRRSSLALQPAWESKIAQALAAGWGCSGDRTNAHQPRGHVLRQSAGRLHESAASRIHISAGLSAGSAHHRLRSRKDRSGGRSIRNSNRAPKRWSCRSVSLGVGEGGLLAMYTAAVDPE